MKINLLKSFLLLFIALILSQENVSAQIEKLDDGEGLLAVHLLIDGLKYVDYFSIRTRHEESGKTKEIVGYRQKIFGSWKGYYSDEPKGDLIVEELPSGKYEIVGWDASAGGGGGTRSLSYDDIPMATFEILPGRMTYVGKMTITILGDTGAVTTRPSSNVFSYSKSEISFNAEVLDDNQNDLRSLPKKYRGISAENIDIQPLEFAKEN